MLLVDGEKYACIRCIRGHRSSTCKHKTRPLVQVRKRGRPVSDCNHRLAVLPDGTCECGVAAIILPKGTESSGLAIEQVDGGKRRIVDTGGPSRGSGKEEVIRLHKEPNGEFTARPIAEMSCCGNVQIQTQTAVTKTEQLDSCCGGSQGRIADKPVFLLHGNTLKETKSNSSVSTSSSTTSLSSLESFDAKTEEAIKLRSIVFKPDINSPAVIQSLDEIRQRHIPQPSITYADVPPAQLYGDIGPVMSDEHMSAMYDQALYSLESYFAASQEPEATTDGIGSLYGVMSPTDSQAGAVNNYAVTESQNVYVPSGLQVNTSQAELASHLEMLQQARVAGVESPPIGDDLMGVESIDNLFAVYLAAACAVPGGECMCSENCGCPGCMKHGNLFID
ncbi:copper fist DNA binding domain-containing protein [Lipomyces arxii]|uniref:copper fist DNA binding domain-containing protein n=1 Tax=Lipomyces arxii TaxID=56418 RepID=UPI0034CFA54B